MNDQSALRILSRIQSYFGVTLNPDRQHDWLDALRPLDEGTAGTAVQRLAAHNPDKAPTIAQLLAQYRSLDTHSQSDRPACNTCDGTGWEDVIEHHHGRPYSAVAPCQHCTAGTTAQATWHEIDRHRNHTTTDQPAPRSARTDHIRSQLPTHRHPEPREQAS